MIIYMFSNNFRFKQVDILKISLERKKIVRNIKAINIILLLLLIIIKMIEPIIE